MIPNLYRPQLLQAQIAVIPKPWKDHLSCGNYTPISLLNAKLKLLSKVIGNRVAPLLPKLIHNDQVGFIPGRESMDNTTKTLHLISYTHNKHIPTCLLACGAEKVFEQVDWFFLRLTLQQVGLGPKLLPKIMSLYSAPSARVLVNGAQSEPFH